VVIFSNLAYHKPCIPSKGFPPDYLSGILPFSPLITQILAHKMNLLYVVDHAEEIPLDIHLSLAA
jgi:hypothetical protein